jgi:hypothetical protein
MTPKPCDCIARTNEALAARGAQLVVMMRLTGGSICTVIAVHRNGSMRKCDTWEAPMLIATFCPFCGNKYAQ